MEMRAKVEEIFKKIDANEELTKEEKKIISLVMPSQSEEPTNINVSNDNNKTMVKSGNWYKGKEDNGIIDVIIIALVTSFISIISLVYIFLKI